MNTDEIGRLLTAVEGIKQTLDKIFPSKDPLSFPPGYNLPEEDLTKFEEMYEGLPDVEDAAAMRELHREWNEPRVWQKLSDVPTDVVVEDSEGDRYEFVDGEWNWGICSITAGELINWGVTDGYAPFTEIL